MRNNILFTLLFIIITSAITGCSGTEPKLDHPTIRTDKIIMEETPKETIENHSEQRIESSYTNDFSFIINDSKIMLKDWDNKVDLQKILGEPTSQNIEELGNDADTLKGSFIKTLNYDGIQLKLLSPKDNGEAFWIMEMVVNKKGYKTSKGIEVGDQVEEVKSLYPDIEIALDGRTDPNNCAYVMHHEHVDYVKFEVTEGLVSQINIFNLIP